MISQSELKANYSSHVQLRLIVGDLSWDLAKIGPDHVVLREDANIELDECDAEIVMTVDGAERRWNVVLKNGIVPFDTQVKTVNR